MSRQRSASVRGAPISLLLIGVLALVAAVAIQRVGSTPPTASASPPASGAATPSGDSSVGASGPKGLPPGKADRGWVAEIGFGQWLAGSLGGKVLVLPADEGAIDADAGQVVSVRNSNGSATSTVRVRDLANGKLRASVDRPGTVGTAVIVGSTVYISGDDGAGATDAGVQAIDLRDGSVRDVIPPGPAPADFPSPVSRGQLRLDPTGRILGSPICSGQLCTVDLIDLRSGARTTPVRNAPWFLAAVSATTIYLIDDLRTTLRAVDAATGEKRWELSDGEIIGVLPLGDGSRVLFGLSQAGGGMPPSWTLVSVDAASGSRRALETRSTASGLPEFYPSLSDDRFAVISDGGTLDDLLGHKKRAALRLLDTTTGAAEPGPVTLAAP
jgi:hypothetical protein